MGNGQSAALANAPDEPQLAALSRAVIQSQDIIVREQTAVIAKLEAQSARYEAAIENMGQGVSFFDREGRLIRCNRRFGEICGLALHEAQPGVTLREIAERLFMPETCPGAADDYVDKCNSVRREETSQAWTVRLSNGRSMEVRCKSTPEGGLVSTHSDVTELRERRAIVADRISLQKLIDLVPDNLWVKDAASRFVIANDATARQIGLDASGDLIGKTDLELHPEDAAGKYLADERRIVETGRALIDFEEYVIDPAGAKLWISTTKVPLRDDSGHVIGIVGISRDITARKRADDSARRPSANSRDDREERAAGGCARPPHARHGSATRRNHLLDASARQGRLALAPTAPRRASPADFAGRSTGLRIGPDVGSCGAAVYRRERVIVKDIATRILSGRTIASSPRPMAIAHAGRRRSCRIRASRSGHSPSIRRRRANRPRPRCGLSTSPARLAGIAIERKQAEDRIQFMANHDALTGLPNRALLKDRLRRRCCFAERYDRWATVAFIDLDNFKCVNDSLGHSAGDELLKSVANRMVDCVRATDTVVRLGGDEFVVLFFDQPKSVDADRRDVAKTCASAVAQPRSRSAAMRCE